MCYFVSEFIHQGFTHLISLWTGSLALRGHSQDCKHTVKSCFDKQCDKYMKSIDRMGETNCMVSQGVYLLNCWWHGNQGFKNCQEVAKEGRMLGSGKRAVLTCLPGKLGVVGPGTELRERIWLQEIARNHGIAEWVVIPANLLIL